MNSPTRLFTVTVFLCAMTIPVVAQKTYKINRYVDSVLTLRYWRANIDSNYVTRPHTKWTLTGRYNVTGSDIQTEGKGSDGHFVSHLEAERKSTLSVGVSYLGLSLNLSLNPAKLLGKYHDYEIGFRSYGRRFGFDISYQDASNFKGTYEVDGVKEEFTTSDGMYNLRTLNASAYYVFNNRRFSYPAAMTYSYLQRRSAGSFMLAVSGQGQHGKAKEDEETLDFKVTNIGIGAGYGYNYVPGRGWLLHISALPTLIVYSNSSITFNGTKIPFHYHFPELIITSRVAVVRQIGSKKFTGLSVVYNYSKIGSDDDLSIRNSKWLARLYFGFRL